VNCDQINEHIDKAIIELEARKELEAENSGGLSILGFTS
jgi:hypothetical protein